MRCCRSEMGSFKTFLVAGQLVQHAGPPYSSRVLPCSFCVSERRGGRSPSLILFALRVPYPVLRHLRTVCTPPISSARTRKKAMMSGCLVVLLPLLFSFFSTSRLLRGMALLTPYPTKERAMQVQWRRRKSIFGDSERVSM